MGQFIQLEDSLYFKIIQYNDTPIYKYEIYKLRHFQF